MFARSSTSRESVSFAQLARSLALPSHALPFVVMFEAIITPWAKTINMYDRVDVKPCGQFNSIVEGADAFEDFERTELTGAEFGALLMNFDVFG